MSIWGSNEPTGRWNDPPPEAKTPRARDCLRHIMGGLPPKTERGNKAPKVWGHGRGSLLGTAPIVRAQAQALDIAEWGAHSIHYVTWISWKPLIEVTEYER